MSKRVLAILGVAAILCVIGIAALPYAIWYVWREYIYDLGGVPYADR